MAGPQYAGILGQNSTQLSSVLTDPAAFGLATHPPREERGWSQSVPALPFLFTGGSECDPVPAGESHRKPVRASRKKLSSLIKGSLLFRRSVMSDSLQPHGLQHTRPPCPSPSPGVCSNSGPLCRSALIKEHPQRGPSSPLPCEVTARRHRL